MIVLQLAGWLAAKLAVCFRKPFKQLALSLGAQSRRLGWSSATDWPVSSLAFQVENPRSDWLCVTETQDSPASQ